MAAVREADPDIVCGFEVQLLSLGYLIARAHQSTIALDLCAALSRVPAERRGYFGTDHDRWDYERASGIHICGRIVLNAWRVFRAELSLSSVSFQSVMFHVLRRRVPEYSFRTLADWYDGPSARLLQWRTVLYWMTRARGVIDVLDALDVVGRHSEMARILGIPMYETFIRGSQFRIESLMLRIAKPMSYVCLTPSKEQVTGQCALECLQLIMEPESRFYTDPVMVFDFQSLYPSIGARSRGALRRRAVHRPAHGRGRQ